MALFRTLTLGELWEGEMMPFHLGGKDVLLLRYQGRVFAYLDRCPHQGVPLSKGCLNEGILKCSAHGWEFEASGAGHNPRSASLEPLPVKIEKDVIWIEIETGAVLA